MLALIKGGKLWLEALQFDGAAGWLSDTKWGIVPVTLAAIAVWIWHRPGGVAGLTRLAGLGAAIGLAVTLTGPLSSLISAAEFTPALIRKEGPKSPDVVMLTIDTLAANHMSLYGYSRLTTPEMERIAAQAHVFENFYANGNHTTPAINSLINGVRPWTHRANQFLAPGDSNHARQGIVARLKNSGYQVFSVTTNPGATPTSSGTGHLFEKIISSRIRMSCSAFYSITGSPFPVAFTSSGLRLPLQVCNAADRMLVQVGVWSPTDHFDPELAFSATRRLVEERDLARPFFLWVHLFPPHAPYATPEQFAGRFDDGPQARTRFDSTPMDWFTVEADKGFPSAYIGRYDESIAYVDHHVGQFLNWLRRQGVFDEALLIITADHGESFTHDYGGHGGPMLHEDLIHIPLIVKEPRQKAGKRVAVLSEQVDIMPTVLDLAGIPGEGPFEGRSLRPALRGDRMQGLVFSMNFQQSSRFGALDTGSVAAIDGRWKYVHYRGQFKGSYVPKLEDSLYDLRTDPGENVNLIAVHPAVAAGMRTAIEAQLRVHGGPVR